jgi:hypothetical protein
VADTHTLNSTLLPMNHPSLSFLLGGPELLTILLLCAAALATGIVIVALAFKHQQRRLWHETARAALEKGQPLLPYPGAQKHEIEKAWHAFAMNQMAANNDFRRFRCRRDLRGGLVMLAIGAGIFLGLASIDHGERLRVFAFVPGCIGLALLANGLVNVAFPSKEANSTDRPPEA